MLLIKPKISLNSSCPYCQTSLPSEELLWQGIHVCAVATCPQCGSKIISDLPTGHGAIAPYQLDLAQGKGFGDPYYAGWWGDPFLQSLQHPCPAPLKITQEVFHPHQRVIILNCLDYLYGHCLLKLLNAERHLQQQPALGLIVIVPALLRWLVPAGVAEVWTVPLSLQQGQAYYPQFHDFVQQECERFEEIYLSAADSHPSQFDISHFTRTRKHCFNQEAFKVTFIWREDRPWCHPLLFRILRKLKWLLPALWLQNWQMRRLFSQLRRQGFAGEVAIAGLGTSTEFPDWIKDYRVQQFTPTLERQLCEVYADSRLVIGVHGSSLLLPSAHAGMTIDLMPSDRWANIAQDILYQESDPRLASFRYRYLPSGVAVSELAAIATTMLLTYPFFYQELRMRL